jgi:PDZ domain-containing protein
MSRQHRSLLVAAVLVVALVVLGAVLPVPYVTLLPGPVTNTLGRAPGSQRDLIRITGHRTFPTSGHLDLVTVLVDGDPQHEPTLFQALGAWLDPSEAVVPLELIYPPGQSSAQVQAQDQQQMLQSQQEAITAALRFLHIPVRTRVAVAALAAGTPAVRRLRVGDVLLAVDGHPVSGIASVHQLIQRHRAGQSVVLSVLRAGHRLSLRVRTVRAPHSRRVIVGFRPELVPVYPFQISIDLQNVGGPSAGLMFALGIVAKLSPGSLTQGRFVAGTGEIAADGSVSAIGGIQQKVVAATRAGASVFLVPAANCAAARQVVTSRVRLVRVSSLAAAVGALRDLAAGRPTPRC